MTPHPCPGCGSPTSKTRCAECATTARHTYDAEHPSDYDYTSRVWRRKRAAYLRLHPICAEAGCGRLATTVDHVLALSDGGLDAMPNFQGFCATHHGQKTARDVADRRMRVGMTKSGSLDVANARPNLSYPTQGTRDLIGSLPRA